MCDLNVAVAAESNDLRGNSRWKRLIELRVASPTRSGHLVLCQRDVEREHVSSDQAKGESIHLGIQNAPNMGFSNAVELHGTLPTCEWFVNYMASK